MEYEKRMSPYAIPQQTWTTLELRAWSANNPPKKGGHNNKQSFRPLEASGHQRTSSASPCGWAYSLVGDLATNKVKSISYFQHINHK